MLLNFLLIFIVIYLFYYFTIVRRKEKKQSIELKYIIKIYKLDYTKLNAKYISNIIAFSTSFLIALVTSFVNLEKNILRQLILILIILVPSIFIMYHIIGKIYQKRM